MFYCDCELTSNVWMTRLLRGADGEAYPSRLFFLRKRLPFLPVPGLLMRFKPDHPPVKVECVIYDVAEETFRVCLENVCLQGLNGVSGDEAERMFNDACEAMQAQGFTEKPS